MFQRPTPNDRPAWRRWLRRGLALAALAFAAGMAVGVREWRRLRDIEARILERAKGDFAQANPVEPKGWPGLKSVRVVRHAMAWEGDALRVRGTVALDDPDARGGDLRVTLDRAHWLKVAGPAAVDFDFSFPHSHEEELLIAFRLPERFDTELHLGRWKVPPKPPP